MKFSILLPTRNRLELLRLAIQSVRDQDHADWEILISDNASDVDIGKHVQDIGDARIRTRRFEQLVPVTDNWNAALSMATGEYLIMLGDDDALLPGALSRLKTLLETWRHPEAIYAQARQYAYPGVVPDHPGAFVQTGYNAFLEGAKDAFELPPAVALDMVRGAMDFRILFGFNMQHFVFSRGLVERLKPRGEFFQSPYPDYYAANAVLLSARPLVATPDPVALIGISPKSFGFYYVNARENDGVEFLHNLADADIVARLRDEIVPGSNMNDSWLCAMETLRRNFPEAGGRVSYHRYRRLQYHVLLGDKKREGYAAVLKCMRPWEIAAYGAAAGAYFGAGLLPSGAARHAREAISHALFSRSPRFDPQRIAVPHQDILEAARAYGR